MEDKKVWGIEVINEGREEITREADTSSQWDGDDIYYHHDIRGIKVRESKGYFDVTVGFQPVSGPIYYLLAVRYDTGDSFHVEENRIEYVDLFSTYEKAEALQKLILADNGRKSLSSSTLEYENDLGKKIKLYCGTWQGYFESLRECEIYEVQVL